MINKKRISIALSSENVRRIKAIAAKRKTWVSQLLALEIKKIIREDKKGNIKGIEFLTDSSGNEFAVKKNG